MTAMTLEGLKQPDRSAAGDSAVAPDREEKGNGPGRRRPGHRRDLLVTATLLLTPDDSH